MGQFRRRAIRRLLRGGASAYRRRYAWARIDPLLSCDPLWRQIAIDRARCFREVGDSSNA